MTVMTNDKVAATGTGKGEAGRPLLRLEEVKKVFYTDEVETHALSGVHMEIQRGEYVSISGPSGCGKSTLLSILGLLDTATEGQYWLDGKPVQSLGFTERARIRNREIGFIFQSFNLIGDLSVYENVELPLTYRGMAASERKRRVGEALERGEHGASREAPAEPALGRPAAARRGRACARGRSAHPARGRTHREPRLDATAKP
jgi:putative ABC transport system ATP-binding protein